MGEVANPDFIYAPECHALESGVGFIGLDPMKCKNSVQLICSDGKVLLQIKAGNRVGRMSQLRFDDLVYRPYACKEQCRVRSGGTWY
jgi:hypothetical protein